MCAFRLLCSVVVLVQFGYVHRNTMVPRPLARRRDLPTPDTCFGVCVGAGIDATGAAATAAALLVLFELARVLLPNNAVLLLVGLSVLENNGGGTPCPWTGVLVPLPLPLPWPSLPAGMARVLGSGGNVRSSKNLGRDSAGSTLVGDHAVVPHRGGGDTGGCTHESAGSVMLWSSGGSFRGAMIFSDTGMLACLLVFVLVLVVEAVLTQHLRTGRVEGNRSTL